MTTRAPPGQVYLVSDSRERHVLGFVAPLFAQAGTNNLTAQINTGDYLICRRAGERPPEILACIERKTLKDFAVSFKDGRYLNRGKMMDLRGKTGCQLYFFVEGPPFPASSTRFSRVPYGNILSAMTHLMVRDGIFVVQTKNEIGTAQRLLEFVRGFEKVGAPADLRRRVRADRPGGRRRRVRADRRASPVSGPTAPADAAAVPSLVTGPVAKSDAFLVAEIWAKLSGISLSTAQVISAEFSVADLIAGRVTGDALTALRTAGGRPLTRRGRASLAALCRGSEKEELRILSGVPGVSLALAAQLLAGPKRLADLLAQGRAGIAAVTIRQKKLVRLGEIRAERILHLLHHRVVPSARDEEEARTA